MLDLAASLPNIISRLLGKILETNDAFSAGEIYLTFISIINLFFTAGTLIYSIPGSLLHRTV
jgi:hypothetical protein